MSMEKFTSVENDRTKECPKTSLKSKVKNIINPIIVAGAILTSGCGDSNISKEITDIPDNFTKAEEKINKNFEKANKVKQVLQKFGIEIKNGENFSYKTEKGELISATIGDKTYNIDELIEMADKQNDTNHDLRDSLQGGQQRINPETKEYFK